jgi:hypothetical protein
MVLLLVQLGVATERCMAFVRVEFSWGDSVGCKRVCLLGRVEGRDHRDLTRTGRELGLLFLRKFGEICKASTCHKSSLSWLERTIRRSVCCSLRCCKKKQGGGRGEVCLGPSWPQDLPLSRPCKGREVLQKQGKTKD